MKLLLLEDDDLLAESLAESLKDNGYLVDIADSVKSAMSFMATEEYELAILDIGLPDGSGLELITRWRKQKRTIPVLILTARDTWEDKDIGLETSSPSTGCPWMKQASAFPAKGQHGVRLPPPSFDYYAT